MISCGTLNVENQSTEDYFYYSPYNYERVHYIFLNQHNYFQSTLYINEFGQQIYMYEHPYYIRYCREREMIKRRTNRTYVSPVNGYINTNRVNTNYRITTTSRRNVKPTSTRRPTTTRRITPQRSTRRN